MTNQERKIGRMHKEFGIDPSNKCGECSNCNRQRYRDRNYTKCLVYGDTASEATDWVQKWTACGMFNKPWKGPQMMKVFNSRRDKPDTQCDGQMKLFENPL